MKIYTLMQRFFPPAAYKEELYVLQYFSSLPAAEQYKKSVEEDTFPDEFMTYYIAAGELTDVNLGSINLKNDDSVTQEQALSALGDMEDYSDGVPRSVLEKYIKQQSN
jgi:hypothetical protein